MATTSGVYDWGQEIAKGIAESKASGMTGGGQVSGASPGNSFSLSGSGEFTGGSDFPDWLKEPDMHELEDEYAGIDQFFNIGNKIKPIKRLAEAQYSNSLQQGANAADESIARAFQTGVVGPINTSVISAQTAMPALLAKLGATKDIAALRINNMYKEQEARSAMAAQIAGLRKSYVDTMAQFALGKDKLSLDAELGRGSLDLQRDQFEFGQKQVTNKSGGSETNWEELANVMTSHNMAQGNGGAQINWQRFLSGLNPATKSQTADMSLLGI